MILHWLGEMFDPALNGYWGATISPSDGNLPAVIGDNAAKVDGIKISLLDDGEGDRACAAACPQASRCTRAMISTIPN